MVRDLTEERGRLDVLAIEGDRTVRAALDLSYQSLPEPAARLCPPLGTAPGRRLRERAGRCPCSDPATGAGRCAGCSTCWPMPASWPRRPTNATASTALSACTRPPTRSRTRPRSGRPRCAAFDYYLLTATRAEEILDPHHRSLPREFGPDPVSAEDLADDVDTALTWLETERLNLMALLPHARQSGHPAVAWQPGRRDVAAVHQTQVLRGLASGPKRAWLPLAPAETRQPRHGC